MDVSVIIVNFNTKALTRQCIDSVFEKTTGVSFEVILVDNASTDGSIDLFERDERIQFVESGANLGFGKANNLGYQRSKGKYIFFLNSDTILLNNALALFFEKMEKESDSVGCIGCLLQDSEGQYMHSYADFPTVDNLAGPLVWRRFFSRLGLEEQKLDNPSDRLVSPEFFKVGYVTGADMFVRRSVIERCGLFDPDFFMYYEDPELQWRFAKQGFGSYIYAKPRIMHLEGQSSIETTSNKKKLMVFESQMKYLSKTQPLGKVLILKLLLLIKSPYLFFSSRFSLREGIKYIESIL